MKFSVIVPLYNKEAFVERTLRSVLSQTFADYELIVIDDGSSDGSYQKACDVLGMENPRCRIVKQENSGVGAARNKGVALARGEYVAFLDADDWWEPTFLEEVNRLTERYPEAATFATGFYLIKNGKKRKAPIGVEKDFEQGCINYFRVYAKTMCMPVTSSSVAIRKEAFEEAGQFRTHLTFGEDCDLWIRLALKYPVALSNVPLANYFQDLSPKQRATRRVHDPKTHMLWNFGYLAEAERQNADLKYLLDRLRAGGAYKHYLSRQYHDDALHILEQVDWSKISPSLKRMYERPLLLERVRYRFKLEGAKVKQLVFKLTH